ncbi:M36 family metallopeptidase [Tenacibaculum agarivorans]|nr:M36 family metallopeptidase [Tenacibaculum agarivorans]
MKKTYSIVALFLVLQLAYSQNTSQSDLSVIQDHFKSLQNKSQASQTDYAEWKVTSTASSLKKGLTHYYLTQYFKGIPIINGTYNMSVNNNSVNYSVNQFVKDVESKIPQSRSISLINEEAAINTVISSHNLPAASRLQKQLRRTNGGGDPISKYLDSGITEDNEPITAQKVYLLYEDKIHLCWNVTLYEKGGKHWWSSFVDASSNTILKEDDWVISCNFDTPGHSELHNHKHDHGHKAHKDVNSRENYGIPYAAESMAMAPDSYRVYAMPLINPDDGGRTIVTDPAESVASPFGWHDTNGSAGAEFTITRGNNVWAQEDANGNNGTGASPSGGSGLDFDFPVNLNQAPSNYRNASTTNLFYWNNIMHDVWYQYGFDEASGNFQENNYGRGGSGSDSVNADSQDGSGTNNANFGTPPDGSNPRMQMFLWNRTNPGRDGSFDNIIIAHEYGHGISTRLVGGRNSNVLGGSEQMGEGWSDWFGLMLTMKAGDTGADRRGVGTYVLGQGLNGLGIRPTVYSTDRSINDTDYSDIGGLARPHGVGYAFCTILWDMTWLLIDQEGFDPDFYNGTGGNNIAMALVTEGLKNTASNPGFVSGRDGILQADQDLYGGAYRCLIWKAFAERGVGEGANENNNGGTNGQTDQTVSFTNPCDGGGGGGPDPVTCSSTVNSFPYGESFEANDGWTQASGDDGNWVRDANGTPSSGTGPSAGADGSFYMFLEASTNGSTGQIGSNATAILQSPCFDLSSLTSATFSFSNHMFGTSVGSLRLEASTDGTTWTSIWNQSGNQGNQWNSVSVNLGAYVGEAEVRLRFVGTTGTSWSSDIAIDDLALTSGGGGGGGPDPGCPTVNFNNFTITPFSNQDSAGNFSVSTDGSSLTLTNNTWKYIPLNYTVTANTVIEFEFTSTSQGEIHGIGFEDDNTLTATRYFKVHGTQNYGITNFDNYTSGTTTYVIPVGDSYTGTMDRLVFINDNDAGSGNNSTFANVRIYEGSCSSSSVTVASFGARTDVLGDEDEGIFTSIEVAPNPIGKGNLLKLVGPNRSLSNATYSIINMLGQVIEKAALNDRRAINIDSFESGVYILRIENESIETTKRFIIK